MFDDFGDCTCEGIQRIQSSQLSDDEVGFNGSSSPEVTSHDGRVSSLKGNSLGIISSITAFLNLDGLGELSKQWDCVVEDGLKSSKMQYGPTCTRVCQLRLDPRVCSSTLLQYVRAQADLRLFWS